MPFVLSGCCAAALFFYRRIWRQHTSRESGLPSAACFPSMSGMHKTPASSLARVCLLPDVEFIEMPESFRVNLYRSSLPMDSIGETSVEHRQKNGVATVDTPFNLELNSTQIKIIELLSANSNMTGVDLSEAIGISKRNIEVNLKKLKENGALDRAFRHRKEYLRGQLHRAGSYTKKIGDSIQMSRRSFL